MSRCTPEMTRSPYFDRADHGSGLLTWHFDYWRRSNVYFGDNNAQDDANRMQMDVEEWDFNDNTQEIALNLHRGEGSDPVHATATGITSGTHAPNPGVPIVGGDPQGAPRRERRSDAAWRPDRGHVHGHRQPGQLHHAGGRRRRG